MAHAAPERSLALMKTARKLVAVCALVAAYAVGVRPALLRGSATEEEVARPTPAPISYPAASAAPRWP